MSEQNTTRKDDSEKFMVGDCIQAKVSGWTKFYRGKITRVNKSENTTEVTYDVQFDDGERKKNIESKCIKKVNVDERQEEQRVDVIKKMMEFCQSREFLNVFEHYIKAHLKYFKDADETDMPIRFEWITLYEEYLDLFNDTLAKKFLELGVYKGDFFKELSDSEAGNRLSFEEKHFMKLMLASADLKDWVRIMIRESQYYFRTGTTHFGNIDQRLTKDDTEYIDPRFTNENSYLSE